MMSNNKAGVASERRSHNAFLGVSAFLFAASAVATIAWCKSMSAMGEMPMPGGWTMSTAWMRMPGQPWPFFAASFLGMWVVMMVAMMLPSHHDAVELLRSCPPRGRDSTWPPDSSCGVGLLLRLDCVRNNSVSAGQHTGDDRNAATWTGARCTDRGRFGSSDGGRFPVHLVEGLPS